MRAGAGFAKQNRSYTQEPCYVKQGNEANEGIIANTKHKREIDHIEYIVVTLFSFEGANPFGGDSKEAPPVPMPNTEVKLLNDDDTWRETARESSKLPELKILKITTEVVIFGVFREN